MYRDRYWNTADLRRRSPPCPASPTTPGCPLTELSLRWLRSKPATGPILLGGSKTSHLQANIDALPRGPLPDDVVAACDEVGAALRGPMPAYNR